MKRILITGASGFIGSCIAERALAAGYEVWAALRENSSRRYLTDPRLNFITLSFDQPRELRAAIAAHVARFGAWHGVVHAAGATKCRRPEDFSAANTKATLLLANILVEERALTGRFVFMSSLSVMGPIHEDEDAPLSETDTPHPDTAYGRSKLAAESGLLLIEGLDHVVLRPTGVYGPRERDYFMMAKSIAGHTDFAVGFRPQRLTFIYVNDLADAALLALTRGRSGEAYLLSDGEDYSSRAFSDLLQRELGVRHVVHITAPLWVLRLVCSVSGAFARMCSRTSTLNNDKYRIMKQRNWRCDISAARQELGFSPAYDLERGVKESVAWYKQEKWI